MKKSSLIIAGIVLTLTFTGCTKGSSTSYVGNKPSETVFTSGETKTAAEKPTKEPSTENQTEEPETDTFAENQTVEHTEEYNAEEARKKFAESDIPDSIKNIFLSDGVFVDTVSQTEVKLFEFKMYANTEAEKELSIKEWICYTAVDFDGDGKKELFYDVQPQYGFVQRVIFHEYTDGKVYAYRHPSSRESVSENGDILGAGGADLTAQGLYRYSFDTENIISEEIVYAERQEDGGYKYYADGHEVDLAEYEKYFKSFWENCLRDIEFRVTPSN